jgi:prophage regulatory protein
MVNRVLRFPEVKMRSGMSRSTIYLRIAERLFPRPISLGPRMVGWPESEVDALIDARIRGISDEELRVLVAKLEAARKSAA